MYVAMILILTCSSNIIYGYHLTGKWTGAPSGGMEYGMDDGMYSWWHHCVLDSSSLAFRSRLIDIDVNSKFNGGAAVHVHNNLPIGK